jgi:uncharacterized membrane protein YdjX (TVP38/TMEM64 family)
LAIALIAWRTGLIGLATPKGLHAHQGAIEGVLHAHPVLAAAAFIAVYAALTASCLPLALTMTLTSGALFGPWGGAAAALAGGGLGALITYAAARYASFGAKGGERIHQARSRRR